MLLWIIMINNIYEIIKKAKLTKNIKKLIIIF